MSEAVQLEKIIKMEMDNSYKNSSALIIGENELAGS
jgi:hypothetical protein